MQFIIEPKVSGVMQHLLFCIITRPSLVYPLVHHGQGISDSNAKPELFHFTPITEVYLFPIPLWNSLIQWQSTE